MLTKHCLESVTLWVTLLVAAAAMYITEKNSCCLLFLDAAAADDKNAIFIRKIGIHIHTYINTVQKLLLTSLLFRCTKR
jgi:hypothetical protein